MEDELYRQFSKIQNRHWWFRGRLRIFEAILKIFLSPHYDRNNCKILDVGCGTGGCFPVLENFGEVTGAEFSEIAIKILKEQGVKNKIFRAELPAMDLGKKFHCITAFEVLEHIEDDRAALKNISDHLLDGGFLIGTVPAYQWLWSRHDELNRHKRRYFKQDLIQKLVGQGFKIKKVSYYNTLLFPMALLIRILKKTFLKDAIPDSDFSVNTGFSNFIFEKIFASERHFLKLINFPFGLSLIFVAQKI